MNILILIAAGMGLFVIGAITGYFARQSIVKRKKDSIEAKIQKKIDKAKKKKKKIIDKAKKKAQKIIEDSEKKTEERREELLKTEKMLYKRKNALEEKISDLEEQKKNFSEKVDRLKEVREELKQKQKQVKERLEEVSGLTESQAKQKLLRQVEEEHNKELLERMKKLKEEGEERYKREAKEFLTQAIESYAASQAQEITTTTVSLPSDDMKGRIIGKDGRNIQTLEELTGVEVLVDDTPGSVVISGFNPKRRQIAKTALERLIKDGRIQPARIEKEYKKAKEDIEKQIKKFGENALYEVGIVEDVPQSLVELLGKLYFRTSFGQNVLFHSIEVARLAGTLADELGTDTKVVKRAGLFHDIGKAVDKEVEGSHVNIGMKLLEKFGESQEIIDAMKAHHEEYEAKTLEAVLVKVADEISGARPGARKDTVEDYLERIEELEELAASFKGVKKAYSVHAGREIRVFVKPENIGDLEAYKLAKDIAGRIHQELTYPGEIKVNVIRETRVTEYAR